MSLTNPLKIIVILHIMAGEISTRRSLGQELARATESAIPARRPSGVSPAAGYQNHKGNQVIQHKNDKATLWEKAKIERIQKR